MHSKGEDSLTAAGLSVMTASIIFFANIFTIGALLKKRNVLERFINKPLDGVYLMMFLLIINYFLFMHKKKYLIIKEKFADENKKMKIVGGLFVILYCLLSFIFLLIVASYKPGHI